MKTNDEHVQLAKEASKSLKHKVYIDKNALKKSDIIYALKKLADAVDNFIEKTNTYPLTEKSFYQLKKADLELMSSMTLAREILKEKL